ncbi:MAG: lysozyme inhibitor LprI family protein [Cognatishimia sp.]|uniref:lysozyme inhibitor LprI family protein n=1 Tax=Cognatishimia sp. TaxID=2211648 RepID=UPI004058C8BF
MGQQSGEAYVSLLGRTVVDDFALSAQEVDCNNAMTQMDMNFCAAQSYGYADEDLNLAYQLARAQAKQMDEYLQEGEVPSATMLRDAQRAWITFRDLACDVESTLVRGGSMQPLIYYSCLERETRNRTESLRYFGETN